MIHIGFLITFFLTSSLYASNPKNEPPSNFSFFTYCVSSTITAAANATSNVTQTALDLSSSANRALQTRVDTSLQEHMLGFKYNKDEYNKTAQNLTNIATDLTTCTQADIKIFAKRQSAIPYMANIYLKGKHDNNTQMLVLDQYQGIKSFLKLFNKEIPHSIFTQLQKKEKILHMQLSGILEHKDKKNNLYPNVDKPIQTIDTLNDEQIKKFIHTNKIHESPEYKKRIIELEKQANREFFLKKFVKK